MSDLHRAVLLGDPRRVTRLLRERADPNSRRWRGGQTPLMLAASTGRIEVVALLLKAGADPNVRADNGRSALDEARNREDEANLGSWLFTWRTRRTGTDKDPLVRLLVEAGAK
jgi:ankyrin repeat protein